MYPDRAFIPGCCQLDLIRMSNYSIYDVAAYVFLSYIYYQALDNLFNQQAPALYDQYH